MLKVYVTEDAVVLRDGGVQLKIHKDVLKLTGFERGILDRSGYVTQEAFIADTISLDLNTPIYEFHDYQVGAKFAGEILNKDSPEGMVVVNEEDITSFQHLQGRWWFGHRPIHLSEDKTYKVVYIP